MRILIVNYEYPPLGGGGGVLAETLVGSLREDHDVRVLSSQGPPDLPEPEGDGRVLRVPVLARRHREKASMLSLVSFPPSAARAAVRSLGGWTPDVVHTFFAVPSGPAGHWIARRTRTPHVLTVIGADVHDPTRRLSPHRFAPLARVVRAIVRGADAVTAISTDIATKTTALTGRDDITVVPCALEPHAPPAPDRVALGWADGEIVVVTVARLIPRKAIDVLIRSLARLPDDVRLEVVGDGPERETLAELARTRAPGRVRFAGSVDGAGRDLRLASADVFVLPSHHEGFGIAILEAMEAGLPVVATTSGGPPDFVTEGETGFLVPPGDEGALAERIGRLAADPELRSRMGARGPVQARRFTAGVMARRYEAVYAQARERRPTSDTHLRSQIAFYERTAEGYDTSIWSLGSRENRNHRQKISSIARAVGAAEASHVLEVGAGTGLHAAWLLDRYAAAYTGVDLSAPMLEAARRRTASHGSRAQLAIGDAQGLPFPDGAFDAGFCTATLHHLADPMRGIAELVRVVRPGGRVAFLEPNWRYPSVLVYSAMTRAEWNTFKISPGRLRMWAERAGLVDVAVQPLLYTPPRPERLTDAFARIDALCARTPGARWLSITLLVSGRRAGGGVP